MPFRKEPTHTHGHPAGTGILLCNLGSPDEPTAPAVRRYLAQFLSDPRVVEIPRVVWLPILHGIILRTRPAKSAAKYRTIWTPEGSPLKVWTEKQAVMLRGWLGERGHRVSVRTAMRYGSPSIASQLDAMRSEGITRVLVLPCYPQYSGTTTASVFDDVAHWAGQARHVPELRFVNQYHDDAGYIGALAARVRAHWMANGRAQQLVMSFHGVPERTLHLGDPYHCQCLKTARLLAAALSLKPEDYRVTFQSRFGRAKWLEPYTEPTLREMAKAGTRSVDVVCPGFVSDCLETLEEISQEARHAFMESGGQQFSYIPCLNDSREWLGALAGIAERHLAGWPTQEPTPVDARARQRDLAVARGAKQ